MPVQAYLRVGPQVSQYPEYREVMVQHLIRHKLGHWDRALRELASTAVAAIVPQDPQLFTSCILEQLLDLCADPCIEVQPWKNKSSSCCTAPTSPLFTAWCDTSLAPS